MTVIHTLDVSTCTRKCEEKHHRWDVLVFTTAFSNNGSNRMNGTANI